MRTLAYVALGSSASVEFMNVPASMVVSPASFCVLGSYSCVRNWKIPVPESLRKFLGST